MAPVAYHSRDVLLQDNNDSRIKNAVYIITIKSFHIRLIRLKMLSKFIQSKFVKLSFMLDRNEIKSKGTLNRWSIWLHKCYLIPAECHLLA